MFLRAALAFGLCVGAVGAVMAADDDPVASAAAAKDYYSETKEIACPNTQFCVAAFTKTPKGKTLTATHVSCVVSTTTPLFAAILTRSENRISVPTDEALIVLEKQTPAAAGGSTLTGFNQDVVYRVKSGMYPLVTSQTTAAGTTQLRCILSGALN